MINHIVYFSLKSAFQNISTNTGPIFLDQPDFVELTTVVVSMS